MNLFFSRRKWLLYLVIFGFLVMIGVQLVLLSNAYKGKEKDFNDKLFYVVRSYEDQLLRDSVLQKVSATDSGIIAFSKAQLQPKLDSVFRKNEIPPEFVYAVGKTKISPRRLSADTSLVWSSAPEYNDGLKATRLRVSNFPPADGYGYFVKVFLPHKPSYLLRSLLPLIILLLFILLALFACFLALSAIIKQQMELAELKSDFINNMTHELKTPLFTISIAAKMLGEQPLTKQDAKYGSYVGSIQQETGRLTRLVDKVLQTASLEKKQLQLDKQKLDLHQAVHAAVQSLDLIRIAQNANITLSLEANDHFIYADEMHIANVLYSLLDNAFKYTEGAPQIHISTFNEGRNIVLGIADKGIGLDARMKKLVFERFFRAHTGNLHNVKGYGIGLSYVKSAVEAHNGTVHVESKPGEGSQFILSLPCYRDGN